MTVKVDVPDFSQFVKRVEERTTEYALIEIENIAKLNAPVDSGFYRNNIKRDVGESSVTANAEYSAVIEYGIDGTRRAPTANMRNAGREVQRKIPQLFRRAFRNV